MKFLTGLMMLAMVGFAPTASNADSVKDPHQMQNVPH